MHILYILLLHVSFSCIATTISLIENTTYQLQADTCLYIADINATINWTPKNYNVNTTIPDGGTYYNSEAGIQVSTLADKCIDRNWTTIPLSSNQIYPDSETKTLFHCAECPSCPAPPSDYCFQNYSYVNITNSSGRYQYSNSITNISIDIQFDVPPCPSLNTSIKTITPTCGTITNDDERNILIINTQCPNPISGTLNLFGGQSYAYGSPHSLAISCSNTNTTCPICEECQACPVCPVCPICKNNSNSFNLSKLLEFNGENCTSTTQICRDYFYELSCTQQEADDGDLPACVSRVYAEKDGAIANCNTATQTCQAEKSDLQEKYDKSKKDQEWVLWLVGGIILIIALAIGIPLIYLALKKANLVEERRITPNPELKKEAKNDNKSA